MLILAFWPIAAEFRYYRPDWLSLWLIFWALYYPQKLRRVVGVYGWASMGFNNR
jgi:cell shape-determining protein MreD